MLKVDFSDHFRIFFSQDPVFVIKREIKLFTLSLKEKVLKVDRGFSNTIKNPNGACKTFLLIFSNLCKMAFQKLKIKANFKT